MAKAPQYQGKLFIREKKSADQSCDHDLYLFFLVKYNIFQPYLNYYIYAFDDIFLLLNMEVVQSIMNTLLN